MSSQSLFFHDYETWGTSPRKDPACQFAGIRTDLDLNIIGKPVNLFCQIPNDYLPHPEACLITGITPQQSLRDGLLEVEFVKRVHETLSAPGTCGVGYNSIRFDDEVTRNLLYRHFYDPYGREWQNGNSRWDIIDMVRACYALRPDGLEWVYREDGAPSFKLELLSQANDIGHENAHDAMSDVYATIGLAKKIKTAQPKLYEYLFNLRNKRAVGELIDCYNLVPLVHVSSKLPAQQGCCTWVVPVAYHPRNKNAIITLNLAQDPTPLFELSEAELKARLYAPSDSLAEGEQRLPIKLIHLNKCPVLAPAKTLTEQNAERLGIDREQCLANLQLIRQHTAVFQTISNLFDEDYEDSPIDADHAIYRGFFSDHDKALFDRIHQTPAELLGEQTFGFDDPRLATLLFRLRARNYPATLTDEELHKWQRQRQSRLMDPDSPASITLPEYWQRLEQLSHQYGQDADKMAIINALVKYAENL
ncbi:exodeoxyribonuclease I [Aestuariibacter halophilus]|uniref:Exodeoxyribonuclease I n=1 Tax=Fluctibacter halophilus TaxID=226011 RepID=A0ABS8G5Y1_9ALTE|nr:exodeoxyribonuclease I [Aestuariibacter halophilus]MCC2615521.1 exodeoxyribonuclease I [Aestuariibacter halophilus]